MTNPTATTCIATSFEIPKSEHASGIRSKDPPATPEAPQADSAATTLSRSAVGTSTSMPSVCVAARVSVVIVIAAPPILIVAPSGIETEYVSFSRSRRSQRARLTGILAAELRVKNAVTPLSRSAVRTIGYGFLRVLTHTISGLMTRAMMIMLLNSTVRIRA